MPVETDSEGSAPRRGIAARVANGLIRMYQAYSASRPPHCRYEPSCSEYTRQALERFGLVRGFWVGLKRILRCQPWGGLGYDPVPEYWRRARRAAPEGT